MPRNSLADFSFCSVLEDLITNRTTKGRSGKRFDGLSALSTVNNLSTLRNLVMTRKPARTLEIGLSYGGSCLTIAASHRDLGRDPEGQHVALDPFQDSVWDETGLISIDKAGLAGFIDFRPTFSCYELPRLAEQGEQYECVYVDGSHRFEDVFVDFYFITRLLSAGGMVIFDDSPDPHVAKVLRFIRTNFFSSFHEFDLATFRPDQGKSLRYRVAKRLGKQQLTAFEKIGASERAWNSKFCKF